MSEDRGKKRRGGKKQGRRKEKEFMDAALDAFIRSQALQLWRDFVVYRDRQGQSAAEALREAGFFPDKGDYQALWLACWQSITLPAAAGDDGEIFGQIEAAVRDAVTEESAQRLQRGGPTLEDTEDYNNFIRHALGQLNADAGAEKDI